MAEPSTHINYSFEDIQRYLLGKMSAAEMHALEKAALQDPFLSDAIEGYRQASSATVQQHLNEINAALQTVQKDSKVISFKKNFQWLRIAAIVILLAGVGVIGTFFFKTSDKQNKIAQVKKEATNQSNLTVKDSVNAITPETSSVKNNNTSTIIAQNKKRQNIHSPKKEKRNKQHIYTDTAIENKMGTVATISSARNDEAAKSFAPVTLSKQKNDSPAAYLRGTISGLNLNTNSFGGKVIDESNKPVAGVSIETNDKKNAAVTDLNGNFVLQKNDSLLTARVTAVGYENKNIVLKQNAANLIMLKENPSALSDVVVMGYGITKNKSIKQTATPVGGWQNFNNYVINKLNEDSTKENYMLDNDDIVELEFLIDNEGSPYNIHVTKPLDDKRTSKAVDILKSGPKWTNTSKNKKAKVAIVF